MTDITPNIPYITTTDIIHNGSNLPKGTKFVPRVYMNKNRKTQWKADLYEKNMILDDKNNDEASMFLFNVQATPLPQKSNFCVACGAEIPEGDMICKECKEKI